VTTGPILAEAPSAEPRVPASAALGGKPDAARTAWTPYRPVLARRERPLCVHAAKRAAIAGIVAAAFLFFGRKEMGGLVALVSLLLVGLAAVRPSAYRAIDRFFARAGSVVGRVLAYLVLSPVYFLVITPLRALLRTGARARWRSGAEPAVSTYWRSRAEAPPRLDRPY